MKSYLTNRINELQQEYADSLTKIGQVVHDGTEKNINERKSLWLKVNDKKSRLDEVKEVLEYFKENNYVNA